MGGIEVKDLVFTYPGTSSETLRGVDLFVGEGEFLSLIGPSGCGKSTLLRLLAGLERPESGSLFCGGAMAPAAAATLLRYLHDTGQEHRRIAF